MVRVSPFVEYDVLRGLGEGAIKHVWLARKSRNCSTADVVVKYDRGNRRTNILQEAFFLRKAAHEHVIRLIDVCERKKGGEKRSSDSPMLVFPSADQDLANFLETRTCALQPILVRRLMEQLAAALAHVHSCGIIHRKLEPANCLLFMSVHMDCFLPALKLADFGMALHVCGDQCRHSSTQQSIRVKPMAVMERIDWYRPPELWAVAMVDQKEAEDFNETSTPHNYSGDVWSFGAIVYELLQGEALTRRSPDGVEMAKAVADVIGTSSVYLENPEYVRHRHWKGWAEAVQFHKSEMLLPKAGAQWDLVRSCLKWDPAARATMASAKQCRWFAEEDATPGAVPTSNVTDASTLSATSRTPALTPPPPPPPPPESPRKRRASRISSHNAQPWLQPGLPPAEETCHRSGGKCACTGHCRINRHRVTGECDCAELVIGTKYCKECKCTIAGCGHPKNKNHWCYNHNAVFNKAPFCIQLAVSAAPVASLLMPCDVSDFISTSTLIKDDVAMLILTAAIRETLAVRALVEAWKQLPKHYSGSELRDAVLRALAASDGVPQATQLTQLHRGEMGSFFGLVAIATNLGIIRPKPHPPASPHLMKAAVNSAGASQQTFRLGASLKVYEVLELSASKCDTFLSAARSEEHFFQ